MEEKEIKLADVCDFMNVRPIMMELPYPPILVSEKNQFYAELLSIDYCGSISEMSAIIQYINNEHRLSYEKCSLAKTILGIAVAEMIHLQKMGQLIMLLGEDVDFTAKYKDGKKKMWTPEYLNLPQKIKAILIADIDAERATINQYKMHIRMIKDSNINAVLARIIKDEEYHIMMLQTLLKELQ